MSQPSPDQKAVLDSTARVRVVRAAPGSGKTWLVAEVIRRELSASDGRAGGIAALSFTRVGGEEIRTAVGHELGHPHFVGTIDAFLFRYVVRPFLQLVHSNHAAPRLIPADWSPTFWCKSPDGTSWDHRGTGGSNAKSYNLFEICFIDRDASGPVLARPRPFHGGVEAIAAGDRAAVLAAKRRVWQARGWVTHADAAFLASELLADQTHGSTIKAALLCRFQLLIVDELQDTGFFLGRSLRLLLDEPQVRGVLVGDPDQAIYEFNGARPDLFDGFLAIVDSHSLSLARSQRCPSAITACARHLKDTEGRIDPALGPSGHAFLVRYQTMNTDLRRVADVVLEARSTAVIKVITRQTKTVDELTSRIVQDSKPLYCPVLTHMQRAVSEFFRGHNVMALARSRAALELAVFGHEGVSDEDLESSRILAGSWKSLAVRCLLNCTYLDTAQSLYDWQIAAAVIIDHELAAFALPSSIRFQVGKLKPQRRPGWEQVASDVFPVGISSPPAVLGLPVQTVHGVKGETHDVTIFVCPDVTQSNWCPSSVWWPQGGGPCEERRIAYVAMTRSRSELVVCVSEACYERLLKSRRGFIDDFQSMTVDGFVAVMRNRKRAGQDNPALGELRCGT